MKLYRYMSCYELKRFLRGETLKSDKNHSADSNSTSVGFCFLAENTTFESSKGPQTFSPSECLDFLTGIVSEDILACFDVPDEYIIRSEGIYADPFGGDDDLIKITEYNLTEYSKTMCHLVKFAIPIYAGVLEFDWYVPKKIS